MQMNGRMWNNENYCISCISTDKHNPWSWGYNLIIYNAQKHKHIYIYNKSIWLSI